MPHNRVNNIKRLSPRDVDDSHDNSVIGGSHMHGGARSLGVSQNFIA